MKNWGKIRLCCPFNQKHKKHKIKQMQKLSIKSNAVFNVFTGFFIRKNLVLCACLTIPTKITLVEKIQITFMMQLKGQYAFDLLLKAACIFTRHTTSVLLKSKYSFVSNNLLFFFGTRPRQIFLQCKLPFCNIVADVRAIFQDKSNSH